MYWRETTRFLGDLLTLQVTIHVWYIYLDFVDYGKLVHKYVPYIHGAHIGYNSATKKLLPWHTRWLMTGSLFHGLLLLSPHNWVVFHPLHTPKQPGPFFFIDSFTVPCWKQTWHWKIPSFNRKYIFIQGGFSIAMSVFHCLDLFHSFTHPKTNIYRYPKWWALEKVIPLKNGNFSYTPED